MSVLNKSNHPVLMKRVSLETWTLREEIEAKLATLIEQNDEAQIEATKVFYSDLKSIIPEKAESKLKIAPEAPKENNDSEDKIEAVNNEEANAEVKKLEDFHRVFPEKSLRNKGFLFLSELNMTSIIFFSKNNYKPGQNVIIEFHVTEPFTMSIEILKSIPISNRSNIISDSRPGHRILGDFKFYFKSERANLRKFLISIEPEIPPPPKKLLQALKNDDQGGGDDLDLDDLGF